MKTAMYPLFLQLWLVPEPVVFKWLHLTRWKSRKFVFRFSLLSRRRSRRTSLEVCGVRFGWCVVVRELGFKGLYKGSTITLMRDIPYFMIFFPLNHYLVELFTPSSGTCGLGGLLLAGCGAGMTSAFLSGCSPDGWCVVTPMDVIKTRVQAAKGTSLSSSFPKMFLSTLKSEGVTALFKGASMRMAVQAPMFAIMTTAFELQKRFLASR